MTTTTDNAKGALIDSLNGLLADSFALYIKTKNFHWHVSGPQFRDLHLLFDEQAAQIFATTDLIAERVRKNGGGTLTSIGAIAGKTRVTDQDNNNVQAMDMVRELRDDNAELVRRLRETKQAAGDANDNATDGMIDDWTDQTEERVWFLSQIAA
ncbi:MAG: DNA starvation/stationary phase protection protein [Novosphingobium sp.]|nr:DNA starvation/stationary phase protection protein [Novosphingobium sp.]